MRYELVLSSTALAILEDREGCKIEAVQMLNPYMEASCLENFLNLELT